MISFGQSGTIGYFIQTIIAIAISAVFVMSLVSIFLAIWDFIRSQGEESTMRSGWNRVRFMIIGIVLTITFLYLLPFVMNYVGVNNYDLFTMQSIFSRIGELIDRLLNFSLNI